MSGCYEVKCFIWNQKTGDWVSTFQTKWITQGEFIDFAENFFRWYWDFGINFQKLLIVPNDEATQQTRRLQAARSIRRLRGVQMDWAGGTLRWSAFFRKCRLAGHFFTVGWSAKVMRSRRGGTEAPTVGVPWWADIKGVLESEPRHSLAHNTGEACSQHPWFQVTLRHLLDETNSNQKQWACSHTRM